MICRACGNEERASEGYPCVTCGTFICADPEQRCKKTSDSDPTALVDAGGTLLCE